jgi:hypothetical protein
MDLEFNQTSVAGSGNDEPASGAANAIEKTSRNTPASPPGAAGSIPANAIRVVPVDGVVHLPAGTRLDAIKVSGPNLIVTLPDGQVLVIIDGALHTPQIAFGPINISAANIAALIC